MSEDAKDEQVLPPRKRGRMAFLTKDHLRLQIGQFIDKGARAEQLLKESEEKLKNANQKIQTLESRLQNAEEENVAFVKSIGILVQEIKNIRENHEKKIQEKNETYKEWVTVYTEECQKFIVAEKVKWITEIFKQFENEKQKNVKNAKIQIQTTTVPSAAGINLTINTSPSSGNATNSTIVFPAIVSADDGVHIIAPFNVVISALSIVFPELQKYMKQRRLQIQSAFKNLPIKVQTKMQKDANFLASLIQEGKEIPDQNSIMSLLIANRLNADNSLYNIEE